MMATKLFIHKYVPFVERMYRCQQKCKYCKNTTEPPHTGMYGHIESKLAKNQRKQRKTFGRPVCLLISTRSVISFMFILSLGHTIKVNFK